MGAKGEFAALRSGKAAWLGDGRHGFGFVSTGSGALQSHPYTADSRVHGTPGTSPEELIAAAYASSFNMYLALALAESGTPAEHLDTTVLVTLQSDSRGFSIPHLHLALTASVPLVEAGTFEALANRAKTDCAVAKLLNAQVTLKARLVRRRANDADAARGSGRPS